MALSIRSSFEELSFQLEQLHDEKYYYVGEYIFAGSHGERSKVRADVFHLRDIPHGDELDRIVMLFADLPVSKAVMLSIEGSQVIRTESRNSQILVDAFRAMGQTVPAEAVGDIDFDGITQPVRLIYPKPLFLTCLYRWNLLAEGHNAHALMGTDPEKLEAERRNAYRKLRGILKETLREYFEPDPDAWMEDTQDCVFDYDYGTGHICELGGYLDGLQVYREALTGETEAGLGNLPDREKRLQRINDLIRTVKHQLGLLESSARMEVPFTAPEKSAALWRRRGAFLDGISFGEKVAIRVYLEKALDEMKWEEPEQNVPRRHALWQWRSQVLREQIRQMETMLVDEMEENAVDWEDYLV